MCAGGAGSSRALLCSQGLELGTCRVGAGHLATASVSADASERYGGSWDAGTTGSEWLVSTSGCQGSGSVGAGESFPRMDGLAAGL